jgi:HSP20 family protein
MIYRPDKTPGSDLLAAAMGCGTSWIPIADVYQSQCGWLIKLELAGVGQDDVSITVEGRRLLISGFRRDPVVNEDWSHYSMEIAYSRFERTIEMPWSLECADIKTDLQNGMLMIYVIHEEENNERN